MKTDCTECATKKATMGKAKMGTTASGYANHKGFEDVENTLKEGFWDGTKKVLGSTIGYVLAVQIEENFSILKENVFLSSVAQITPAVLIKRYAINEKDANGAFDSGCNGMIIRGAINISKALFGGIATKLNIRGILDGMSPRLITF
jgi:hypothetical protein